MGSLWGSSKIYFATRYFQISQGQPNFASIASVYHKSPFAFLEGKEGLKRVLPARA